MYTTFSKDNPPSLIPDLNRPENRIRYEAQQRQSITGATSNRIGVDHNVRDHIDSVCNKLLTFLANPHGNFQLLEDILPKEPFPVPREVLLTFVATFSRRLAPQPQLRPSSGSGNPAMVPNSDASNLLTDATTPLIPPSHSPYSHPTDPQLKNETQTSPLGYTFLPGAILNENPTDTQISWSVLDYQYLKIIETLSKDKFIQAALKLRQSTICSDGFEVSFFGRPIAPHIAEDLNPRLRDFMRSADNWDETAGIILVGKEEHSEEIQYGCPYIISPLEYMIQYGVHLRTKKKHVRVLQPVIFNRDNPLEFHYVDMKAVARGEYTSLLRENKLSANSNGTGSGNDQTQSWRLGWLVVKNIVCIVRKWPKDDGRVDSTLTSLLSDWVINHLNELEYNVTTKCNANRPFVYEASSSAGAARVSGMGRSGNQASDMNAASQVYQNVLSQESGGGSRSSLGPSSCAPLLKSKDMLRARDLASRRPRAVAPFIGPSKVQAMEMLKGISPWVLTDMYNEPNMFAQMFNINPSLVHYYSSASRISELLSNGNVMQRDPTLGKDVGRVSGQYRLRELPLETPPPHYMFQRSDWIDSVASVLEVPRILIHGTNTFNKANQSSVVDEYRQTLSTRAQDLAWIMQIAAVLQWGELPKERLLSLCEQYTPDSESPHDWSGQVHSLFPSLSGMGQPVSSSSTPLLPPPSASWGSPFLARNAPHGGGHTFPYLGIPALVAPSSSFSSLDPSALSAFPSLQAISSMGMNPSSSSSLTWMGGVGGGGNKRKRGMQVHATRKKRVPPSLLAHPPGDDEDDEEEDEEDPESKEFEVGESSGLGSGVSSGMVAEEKDPSSVSSASVVTGRTNRKKKGKPKTNPSSMFVPWNLLPQWSASGGWPSNPGDYGGPFKPLPNKVGWPENVWGSGAMSSLFPMVSSQEALFSPVSSTDSPFSRFTSTESEQEQKLSLLGIQVKLTFVEMVRLERIRRLQMIKPGAAPGAPGSSTGSLPSSSSSTPSSKSMPGGGGGGNLGMGPSGLSAPSSNKPNLFAQQEERQRQSKTFVPFAGPASISGGGGGPFSSSNSSSTSLSDPVVLSLLARVQQLEQNQSYQEAMASMMTPPSQPNTSSQPGTSSDNTTESTSSDSTSSNTSSSPVALVSLPPLDPLLFPAFTISKNKARGKRQLSFQSVFQNPVSIHS